MRVLLKLLLLIISFVSVCIENTIATEIVPACAKIVVENSSFTVVDELEEYFLVANNNNYEITVSRKDSNDDLNNDRNNTNCFGKFWELNDITEVSHSNFGEKNKISSYLKNVICIRAP